MLSKAALTAGNPEGDVMWGVDNTLLSRAVEAGVFEPYESPALDAIAGRPASLVPDFEATPVDYGDVCVNYDIGWFAERQLDPPTDFDDLLEPAYADLLVVENPATSSPGLAFLLATIATYGDGWQRLLDVADAPTGSRWSTAGPRPTTSASRGAGGGRARWWSATRRARRPR